MDSMDSKGLVSTFKKDTWSPWTIEELYKLYCTFQSPRQSLWSPWNTRNPRINMWTPWTLYKIHRLYKKVNGVHGLSMDSMDIWWTPWIHLQAELFTPPLIPAGIQQESIYIILGPYLQEGLGG